MPSFAMLRARGSIVSQPSSYLLGYGDKTLPCSALSEAIMIIGYGDLYSFQIR